jgi:hypothetical protein
MISLNIIIIYHAASSYTQSATFITGADIHLLAASTVFGLRCFSWWLCGKLTYKNSPFLVAMDSHMPFQGSYPCKRLKKHSTLIRFLSRVNLRLIYVTRKSNHNENTEFTMNANIFKICTFVQITINKNKCYGRLNFFSWCLCRNTQNMWECTWTFSTIP